MSKDIRDDRIAGAVAATVGAIPALAAFCGVSPTPAPTGPTPRLEFWGVWPLATKDGLFLGRLAWALGDKATTEWVKANVKTFKTGDDPDVTEHTVNGRPTHHMCWAGEEEYDRVAALVRDMPPPRKRMFEVGDNTLLMTPEGVVLLRDLLTDDGTKQYTNYELWQLAELKWDLDAQVGTYPKDAGEYRDKPDPATDARPLADMLRDFLTQKRGVQP